MMWFVYHDREFVGTVIAADEAEALQRASEKFGPIWGIVDVYQRRR